MCTACGYQFAMRGSHGHCAFATCALPVYELRMAQFISLKDELRHGNKLPTSGLEQSICASVCIHVLLLLICNMIRMLLFVLQSLCLYIACGLSEELRYLHPLHVLDKRLKTIFAHARFELSISAAFHQGDSRSEASFESISLCRIAR